MAGDDGVPTFRIDEHPIRILLVSLDPDPARVIDEYSPEPRWSAKPELDGVVEGGEVGADELEDTGVAPLRVLTHLDGALDAETIQPFDPVGSAHSVHDSPIGA